MDLGLTGKVAMVDEAECGHHYARAMASWAAILALTGFHYSAVTKTLEIGARLGRFPRSTGSACGEMDLARQGPNLRDLILTLTVHEGSLAVEWLKVEGRGVTPLRRQPLVAGERIGIAMSRRPQPARGRSRRACTAVWGSARPVRLSHDGRDVRERLVQLNGIA